MRARIGWRTAMIVTALLAVVACSSGDDDATDDGDTGGTAATSATTDAAPSTTPTSSSTDDLTIIDLNMLHGLPLDGACPAETASCQAAARMGILWEEIEAAGCPDVITLQEVGPAQLELLPQRIGELCDGVYTIVSEPVGLPVEVEIITSLPVLDHDGWRMSGINWAAQWAKLDASFGPVEIVTAHFQSSADPFACDASEDYCADLCPPGGHPGDCHPLEVLDAFEQHGDPGDLQIVTGDLNKPFDDPRIQTLVDAGFVDTWTLAGNPECDPATGEGCTCCIDGDPPLVGLDQPDQVFDERIDFVLARVPASCDLNADSPDDADGDGIATGHFANEPRPEPIEGVVWPSDHSGVQSDLSCGGS
jgi:hypothetical protein